MKYILSFLIALLMIYGCASINETGESVQSSNGNAVKVNNNNASLADYLRRVPGVQVQGTGDSVSLMVRGAQSVNASNNPLFVINGRQVGNSYSTANSLVDVNDIESVQVLKSSEGGSQYGLAGSNGVIIIKTKGQNKSF